MARWEEALDAQIDIARYWKTDEGIRYGIGWVNSVASKAEPDSDVGDYRRDGSAMVLRLLSNFTEDGNPFTGLVVLERSKLHRAEPIYIAPEIFDIAQYAAESFQPEPLMQSDLLTDFGFMLLPKPLSLRDAAGKRASFRAITWMPATVADSEKTGIAISLYSYKPDVLNPEYDDYADDFLKMEDSPAMSQWGMLHTMVWWFGDDVPDESGDPRDLDHIAWWKAMQSLFRISQGYVSSASREWPSRSVRKRASRAELDDRYITVVTLRRPKSKPTGDEHNVEWSHRWLVHGHWRSQHYPSLGPASDPAAHRQIWISDYIKGPEAAELRLPSARVFEVVR